ncbi:Fc.00g046080.m01.CDS01 [Cosmosporella sp. VM-42]
MPSKKPLFSDLVRDSKIETESLGSYIRHVFHEAGRSVGERLVRREERWVRQKYLGQGTYGTVYLEKSEDGAGDRLRAVKEVKKFVVLGQELDYARELEAIMKFSHPRYKHCFVSSKGWYELEDSVFITMEFLELGDLQRYLTQPLPESEGKQITEQILEGLGFMHDNGFIHRDLKPANVMVVAKAPKWFVKIADFGISKRRQQEVTTMLTLQRGTLGFAAPEALGAVPDNSYTFSVDMWSLGAVAYRILTNTTAFQSLSELFQYAHGMLQFPEAQLKACAVSEQGQAFIMNLMQPRPDARLSAAAAASHSWITTHLPNSTNNNEESFPAEAIISEPADNTGVSVASKAWSNESTTIVLAESTALPVSRSNYQPPSVSDCLDEPERHENFILPADSRVVLDEAIINTDDQSSAANDYTSVQEEAELSQETIRLNPRPSSIANKENEEIHQGENHETNSSSEQNSPSDPKIGGTFAGSAAKSETAAQDDTDLWGSWGIGKKKKKTITEEDPWGIFSTWKKKMKKTTIPDDDPRGVWGQPKRKENNPNNAESGNGNNILQERDHENDNRPGASNSNSDKDAGTVGCQRHSIPSKQPHDTSAENSFDPAVNNKNNTKASEPRPVAPDRKQPK